MIYFLLLTTAAPMMGGFKMLGPVTMKGKVNAVKQGGSLPGATFQRRKMTLQDPSPENQVTMGDALRNQNVRMEKTNVPGEFKLHHNSKGRNLALGSAAIGAAGLAGAGIGIFANKVDEDEWNPSVTLKSKDKRVLEVDDGNVDDSSADNDTSDGDTSNEDATDDVTSSADTGSENTDEAETLFVDGTGVE